MLAIDRMEPVVLAAGADSRAEGGVSPTLNVPLLRAALGLVLGWVWGRALPNTSRAPARATGTARQHEINERRLPIDEQLRLPSRRASEIECRARGLAEAPRTRSGRSAPQP